MPPIATFHNPGGYYATLAHEKFTRQATKVGWTG